VVDEGALVDAARRSGLDERADWTLWADKVVSF
jgi:sulfur relay (sulfurtransferase) complex TusBCD TusD component (DsrE family)